MEGRTDLVASAAYRPEPAAVAAARKFVRETLQSWLDPGPHPDDAGPASPGPGSAAVDGADPDAGPDDAGPASPGPGSAAVDGADPDAGPDDAGPDDPGPDGAAGETTVLVDDAVLLVSELVTNAVVHAGTPVQVTCKLAASGVEVVVRDSHPAKMVPGPARDEQRPAERTSGRGLLLPSALASAWGVSYGARSKAVWFRMAPIGQNADGTGPGADPEPPETAVPAVSRSVRSPTPSVQPGTGHHGASYHRAGHHGPAGNGNESAAEPGYDELLCQSVAQARVVVAADAAYALVADEDGDLSVRAATGISPAALLRTAPSVSTVPFLTDGRLTGVLAVAAVLPGRFGETDIQRLQELADRMAPALERARLAGLERARQARIGVLAEASDLLAGPLEEDRVLAVAQRIAVPRLAAWSAVLLAGPGGRLRPASVRHADDSQRAALAWLVDQVCAQEATAPGAGPYDTGLDGKSARGWPLAEVPLAGAPAGAAELASHGGWCFPLVTPAALLGLLILGGPGAARPSREVAGLAGDLAGRIALALENARLGAHQRRSAEALRAALVPPELPRIPGVELAFAHDLPGAPDAVGGDFCDVFPVRGGRWRFAVGEVCGSGPPTLAVAALARSTLRILAAEGHSIPAVLDRLNELILAEGAAGVFLTLVHGELGPGEPGPGEPAQGESPLGESDLGEPGRGRTAPG